MNDIHEHLRSAIRNAEQATMESHSASDSHLANAIRDLVLAFHHLMPGPDVTKEFIVKGDGNLGSSRIP